MNLKFKKVLSVMSASSLVIVTSTSVVACRLGGFDFNTIRNRIVNPKEYLSIYTAPPNSWNPIATASSSDSEYLANIYATVLAVDEYGRTYGDLVESGYAGINAVSGGKSIYVGNDSTSNNVNLTKWKYKLRKGAKWFRANGEAVRDIKASDFLLTAKYALTPANTVTTLFLWKQFIRGAEELYTYLGNHKDPSMAEALAAVKTGFDYQETNLAGETTIVHVAGVDGGFGIVVDDNTNTVEFNLLKPAPYFESLLTYNVFSPTPAENYAVGQTGRVPDPSITLFSGAYLPYGDILSSSKMEFIKNKNYYFANKTEIEKITFKKVLNFSPDLTRTLFETGEILAYGVNPNDAVGWERYVGSDLDKPKVEEVSVGKSMATQTFLMTYNMNYANGNVSDQKIIDGSRLLQSKAARALLSTGFNRNVFGKYYSARYDENNDVSLNVRNSFTPTGFASYDGVDYVKNVETAIKANHPKVAQLNDFSIDDGNEILLNHQDWYTDFNTRENLVQAVRNFVEVNGLTKNSNGKVELIYVGRNASNSTVNPYLTRAFTQFNEIPNNPIEIKFDILSDADFMTAYFSGAFHLFNVGWTPDYNDPATFLGTLIIDGDLNNFTGLSTEASSSSPLFLNEGSGKDVVYKVNDTFKTTESDQVIAFAQDYTKKFLAIDSSSTYNQAKRYKDFGEIEAQALFKDFLVLPNFNPAPPKSYSISYLRPYTFAYATYGVSPDKIFTYRVNEQLWKKDQVDDWRNLYRAEKNKIDTNLSYKKSGNIFYES